MNLWLNLALSKLKYTIAAINDFKQTISSISDLLCKGPFLASSKKALLRLLSNLQQLNNDEKAYTSLLNVWFLSILY